MKIYVELLSHSMVDTISFMPVLEEFSKTNKELLVRINSNFEFLFTKSFPDIIYYRDGMEYDKHIKVEYDFNRPIQTGFAYQLGFDNWGYKRPRVDSFKSKRPVNNKYISIGVHSTSQVKYWNHPSGKSSQVESIYWDELCGMIRKSGYTPVVIERDETFGVSPFMNGLPSKANKKIGLSLIDVINHIEHSEFFIGLSSGLAWLAHALGKPVVMISNFTEDWNEFDISLPDYKRIVNKKVCHGCWNQVGRQFNFDNGDWYWCPKFKNTNRQFECHTSITPGMVYNEIKDWLV